MRYSLLISAYDEYKTVRQTLSNTVGTQCRAFVVQSEAKFSMASDAAEFGAVYSKLSNLQGEVHPKALPAHALVRNFNALINLWREMPDCALDTYLIFITGDTLLLHLFGIKSVIAEMEQKKRRVGCSKAIGQNFHDCETDVPNGEEGGRVQSVGLKDFMPQMFIVRAESVLNGEFGPIKVTNHWCSEQCLGDALNGSPKYDQYLFSNTAYGFTDGVVYHVR